MCLAVICFRDPSASFRDPSASIPRISFCCVMIDAQALVSNWLLAGHAVIRVSYCFVPVLKRLTPLLLLVQAIYLANYTVGACLIICTTQKRCISMVY